VGYARGVARAEDRYCPACRRSVEGPWCPDDGVATLRLGGPQVESSALVPGTLIAGRYRVEARLGDGGFGTVFRARHLGTGQPMALKVLRTEPEDRDTLLPRFFQEARITAGLTHPNTVRVFDFGQDERGVVFLAMELVAGKTLTHELGDRARQGQRFAEAEAAWVVSEVLASLAEAHALGLVHRDLKPDNVMLYGVPGDELARVKVLDFGIVKARNASLTVAGAAPFTPAFASPEQVSGGALDGRSDLYSLGALLFLLLTGEPPFRASTPLELMYMHVVQPAPSLLERPGLGISAAMAGLVARALAKDPDERFADAHTMREALLRCVERHLLEAPHAPTRPRAPALDETDEAPLPAHLRADTDAGASSERARPSGAAATPRVDDTPPMVQAAPRGGDTSPIESITEPPIEDTAPGWTARGGHDPALGPADTTPNVASPAHHGGFVGDTPRAVAASAAPIASHASAAPVASHASAVPVAPFAVARVGTRLPRRPRRWRLSRRTLSPRAPRGLRWRRRAYVAPPRGARSQAPRTTTSRSTPSSPRAPRRCPRPSCALRSGWRRSSSWPR
jgi:serine/threonine protein kinase